MIQWSAGDFLIFWRCFKANVSAAFTLFLGWGCVACEWLLCSRRAGVLKVNEAGSEVSYGSIVGGFARPERRGYQLVKGYAREIRKQCAQQLECSARVCGQLGRMFVDDDGDATFVFGKIQTHKRFKRMLFTRTQTQSANCPANPLYQATKRHLNNS